MIKKITWIPVLLNLVRVNCGIESVSLWAVQRWTDNYSTKTPLMILYEVTRHQPYDITMATYATRTSVVFSGGTVGVVEFHAGNMIKDRAPIIGLDTLYTTVQGFSHDSEERLEHFTNP